MSIISRTIPQMEWDTEKNIVYFNIDGTGIVGCLILSKGLNGQITVRMVQAAGVASLILNLRLNEGVQNSPLLHSS